MAFATAADGTWIRYEDVGEGEPLLLVAGQASDHTLWLPLFPLFAPHHRLLVYDHRGTGASDLTTDPAGYSTRAFAGDAVAVLDAAGVDRAHVYGLSMGGRIAQWLAVDHPDRVGAVVLGCTTPGNAHGVARTPAVEKVFLDEKADPRESLALMFDPAWDRFEEMLAMPEPPRMRTDLRALHFATSEGHDAWDALPSITAPVLVLHGTDDEVNPAANAPLLADRIPGAELELLPGTRHGFFLQEADRAAELVLDFLRRHPLPTPA